MCLSGFEAQVSDSNPASPKLFDSDPDPYFHFEGEPDPDPNFSMFNGKFWPLGPNKFIAFAFKNINTSLANFKSYRCLFFFVFKLVLTSFKHTYSIIE